jgi:hypothetical protein
MITACVSSGRKLKNREVRDSVIGSEQEVYFSTIADKLKLGNPGKEAVKVVVIDPLSVMMLYKLPVSDFRVEEPMFPKELVWPAAVIKPSDDTLKAEPTA